MKSEVHVYYVSTGRPGLGRWWLGKGSNLELPEDANSIQDLDTPDSRLHDMVQKKVWREEQI